MTWLAGLGKDKPVKQGRGHCSITFSALQALFEGMAQSHGGGGPYASCQASPQDVAAVPTASSSSGLGFILLDGGRGKGNNALSNVDRKELIFSLLKDTAMVEELSATNLCIGWYGYDIDASDECSLKTETNDDLELWKPHPVTEDCPICFVPLPLKIDQFTYFECCGKNLCSACCAETNRALKITNSERKEKNLPVIEELCAFCRTVYVPEEEITHLQRRIQKGDTDAMVVLADNYAYGDHGLVQSKSKWLELLQMAADLGDGKALGTLGHHLAIEARKSTYDLERGRTCLKEGSKRGCAFSRHNLGLIEEQSGNVKLEIEHWHLAASAGYSGSMKKLWVYFHKRLLGKEKLESTLRAYQASCERMSSEDRRRWLGAEDAKACTDEQLKKFYQSYYDGNISAKTLDKQLKAHRKLRKKMMV